MVYVHVEESLTDSGLSPGLDQLHLLLYPMVWHFGCDESVSCLLKFPARPEKRVQCSPQLSGSQSFLTWRQVPTAPARSCSFQVLSPGEEKVPGCLTRAEQRSPCRLCIQKERALSSMPLKTFPAQTDVLGFDAAAFSNLPGVPPGCRF